MRHAFVDPAAGFPPIIRVSGDFQGEFSTLDALRRAALAGVAGQREHLKLWSAKLEWTWWAGRAEGWTPQISIRPGHGVASVALGARVTMAAAEPLIPADLMDRLKKADAAQGYSMVMEALRTLETVTGQEVTGGIGSAGARWVIAGGALGARMRWRHKSPAAEVNRACWSAYHGGLCVTWRPGVVALQGEDGGAWWGDAVPSEVHRLPEGWRIVELDRSSAYAADAAKPLPDLRLPTVPRADAEGGAICEATVTMEPGVYVGLGIPVRIQHPGGARIFPMRDGAWRGHWTSEMLAWAERDGARVEIHRAWGWRSAAPFLAGAMRKIWTSKASAERGTVTQSVASALMQRMIGRMGRSPTDCETLTGDDATTAYNDPTQWAARWRKIHLAHADLMVCERIPAPDETLPPEAFPPWPAFVVSRAWIALSDRVRGEQERGMLPLYSDTDSICGAVPPGYDFTEMGTDLGDWRISGEFGWADHRRQKIYARGKGELATHLAAAGVAADSLREYFLGGRVEARQPSVLETYRGAEPTVLQRMIEQWTKRAEERRKAEAEDRKF